MFETLIELDLDKCVNDAEATFIFRIMLALNDIETTTFLTDYLRVYKQRATSRKFMVAESQLYLALMQASHCIEASNLLSTLRTEPSLSALNQRVMHEPEIKSGYDEFFKYEDDPAKKTIKRRINNLRDHLVFHYNFTSRNDKAAYTKRLIADITNGAHKAEVQFGHGEFSSPTCFFVANELRMAAICKEWNVGNDLESFEKCVFPDLAELVSAFRALATPLCLDFCLLNSTDGPSKRPYS